MAVQDEPKPKVVISNLGASKVKMTSEMLNDDCSMSTYVCLLLIDLDFEFNS